MKEIGGFIELDSYNLPMLHEGAIALNCGRNCLAYLFKSKGIRKVKLPYYICESIPNICDREGVQKSFYHIGIDFRPSEDINLESDEWLYFINYYGQIKNDEIEEYVSKYKRVVVDQANAYFQMPIPNVDTIYTCRKWFGVADGAFLYTDSILTSDIPQDESYNRMKFLFGRYERTANEFYGDYKANNKFFISEPIKRMSKLTENLLHAIDYDAVKHRRQDNFAYLQERFAKINQLNPQMATFMYPLMVEDGASIRRKLQAKKIYIPTLWPSVFDLTEKTDLEYQMVENILPLPIDQRYGQNEMEYIFQEVMKCIN